MKGIALAFILLLVTPAFAQYDEGLPQTIEETIKEIAKDLDEMSLELRMLTIIHNFMDKNDRFAGPFIIESIEHIKTGILQIDQYYVSITIRGERSYLLLIVNDHILASQSINLIDEECSE